MSQLDLENTPAILQPTPQEEKTDLKYETEHIEQLSGYTAQAVDTGIKFRLVQDAPIEAESFERDLTTWQAVKLYRKVSPPRGKTFHR